MTLGSFVGSSAVILINCHCYIILITCMLLNVMSLTAFKLAIQLSLKTLAGKRCRQVKNNYLNKY